MESNSQHPQTSVSPIPEKVTSTAETTKYLGGSSVHSDTDVTHSEADLNIHAQVQLTNQNAKDLTAGNNDEFITGIKLYTLFLALLLIVLMIALDAAIISTAIPRITDDFHTIANVGWYGSSYMIANACLQPLTGKVYKFFSLKLSFVTFVVLFELGSILCATANSSMMLVIGRAVAGMGGSGISNGSLTLVGIAAPPAQRPTIIGIIMSMFGIGQLIGPLIGGALTQHASWRWCFWINVPIGAASVFAILAIRLPPRDEVPKLTRSNFLQHFDIVGFLLFAPASIMMLLALQWGGIQYAWSSATIIGLLVGSGVTFVVFIIWEYYQADHAMFPRSLLGQKVIAFSIVATFFLGGSLLVLAYYLPLWFQAVKHASPTDSAVHTLPTFISQFLLAIISGPLSNKIGFFTPLYLAGSVLAAIGTGLMATFTPTTSTAKWIGYQILSGSGRGLAFQQPINVMQAALTKAQLSTGMAIIIWSQFLGAAVCLALAQTVFSTLLKSSLEQFAPGVDPRLVYNAGATNYENVVPVADREGVLLAYNQAIVRTFYFPTALAVLAALASVGMGWKRVIAKKDAPKKKADEKA